MDIFTTLIYLIPNILIYTSFINNWEQGLILSMIMLFLLRVWYYGYVSFSLCSLITPCKCMKPLSYVNIKSHKFM